MKQAQTLLLTPEDNHRLVNLCGQLDEHLQLLEKYLHVRISCRGFSFKVEGDDEHTKKAVELLRVLYDVTAMQDLNPETVFGYIQSQQAPVRENNLGGTVHTVRGLIKPRSKNQQLYVDRILKYDLSFGIGPAGTGKTYLAVACAVAALEQGLVNRIILVRPALEAGERLGFLPGDIAEKIDPYLRPLYDALHEMLGAEKVMQCLAQNTIEIAPLAYMRGRTLNDAFIILDESQNTTIEQMKMFLTRMGFNSKCVITGDTTQIDLPKPKASGLVQTLKVLKDIDSISFTIFENSDVVRHPLVQKIVQAYHQYESHEA
ncbi:MAG: PhoH family protein [Legionellales bacterium]|jgi:phosphate starvation-inducible PhoH-like protein